MAEEGLKKILARLNKNRAEEDKMILADNQPKDYFVKDVISTGSAYLDYRISKEIGRGGFIKGNYNMCIGGEGSAKTSVALLACKKAQEEGSIAVYFDGESALNESYLQRFGIDKSLFLYYKGRNLEDMLDAAQEISLATDVGIIVIDSIPIFVSSVVEEKTAEENNMAVEARKYTARMPIIEGNCSRRNTVLLGLTFYTNKPSAIGDPRTLKRGEWQKLMSNLTLEFTKKKLIFDENKKPIGHTIDVRIKKSKLSAYDAKDAFQINFYYDYGFNDYDEYVQIFLEEGLIQGSGWYTFPNSDDEEIKIQGLPNVVKHMKENESDFQKLKRMLKNE